MLVAVFHFNEKVRTILGVSKVEQIEADGKSHYAITQKRISLATPAAILYPCDEYSLVIL